MRRFHIHPGSGEVKRCWASVGRCPFGGEHYKSEEEARAAYEQQYSSSFTQLKTKLAPMHPLLIPSFEPVRKAEARLFPSPSKPRAPMGLTLDDDATYQQWSASLPPAQRQAMELYRGSDSRPINNAFRHGDGISYLGEDLVATGETTRAEVVRQLQQLIKDHGSKKPELLYHGLDLSNMDAEEVALWREHFKPGVHVGFPAFVSAAQSPRTAEGFLKGQGIVFELYGAGAVFINSYEEESLFSTGTVWKIVGVNEIRYEDTSTEVIQLLRKDAP